MRPSNLRLLQFRDIRENPTSLPDWVHSYVRDNRSMIAAKTGADLSRVTTLGCGSYGCAFPLPGSDTVVIKVTSDKTEGPLNQMLIDLRRRSVQGLDGVVDVYDVWQGPDVVVEGEDCPSYVIAKEAVLPLSKRDVEAMDAHDKTRRTLDALERTIPLARKIRSTIDRLKKRPDDREATKDAVEYLAAYRRMTREIDPVAPFVAETLRVLLHEKVVFGDGHWGNIGRTLPGSTNPRRKTDDLVLLELGHSESYGRRSPRVKRLTAGRRA